VSESAKPVIPENTTWKSLASGIVLLDINSGSYHMLNETASAVWRGIVENKAVGELVENLVSEFDCTREVAAADVDELIENLVGQNLLEMPA
jgi:Coenzyme PQQ synthesis protein D (PqqD)